MLNSTKMALNDDTHGRKPWIDKYVLYSALKVLPVYNPQMRVY